MVDQTPIGRTTRSNPGQLRRRVRCDPQAASPPSRSRRSAATPIGTFSFNSGNGRCPTCGGNGFEHVEMQFLSDVYLRCADCNGRRYRAEMLEVKIEPARAARPQHRRRARHDGVARPSQFFAGEREVLATLQPLVEVGLDYLRLGQPVPTLSGGEAQRLKLAGHLAEQPS